MNNLDKYIDHLLDLILRKIEYTGESVDKFIFFKSAKGKLSSTVIAEKFNINTSALGDFELRWKNYLNKKNDYKLDETNALRLIISLEFLIKLNKIIKSQELNTDVEKDELSIKQVRFLELIIRDIIYNKISDQNLLILKLSELFNDEQIKIWIKNADESGLLSGTSFSELSNIFLTQNLFLHFETFFEEWSINISSKIRETLRFALEDIRVIRNQIAHNKTITYAQIELLNIYYLELVNSIEKQANNAFDLKKYTLKVRSTDEDFILKIKQDQRDYWYSFLLFLKENKFNVSNLIPSKQHWMTILERRISINHYQNIIQINAVVNNKKKLISVEIFIYDDLSKNIFDYLHKIEIENSITYIDKNIKWDRLEGRKGSRIIHQMEGDFLEKEEWDTQFIWLKRNIDNFLFVFEKYFVN